jgi:hypothetical protein
MAGCSAANAAATVTGWLEIQPVLDELVAEGSVERYGDRYRGVR